MNGPTLTAAQIAASCGCSLPRAENWHAVLAETMAIFAINTPARRAAFLAQIAHESGRLAFTTEIWGPKQVPAQARYEGRADLGNTQPGDGFRFRGRGLIQTTGRANFRAMRDGLRAVMPDVPDFEAHPELLAAPRWAALSAGWYWHRHGCNELSDTGGAYMQITRRINGGQNGYADRLALWDGAKAALGIA